MTMKKDSKIATSTESLVKSVENIKVEERTEEKKENKIMEIDEEQEPKLEKTQLDETVHQEQSEDEIMQVQEAMELSNHLKSNIEDPEMQMQLAWSLGYPSTWRVVRVYPHPATPQKLDSFMDRIYAGDPAKNIDAYFNHHAAMIAALRYEEGVSTGYENKGGQMFPRTAKFNVKDTVEVLYEDDGQWYEAEIVKVKIFLDDIRYTIYYKDEDATQTNVCESLVRQFTSKSSKKHESKKSKKRAPSEVSKKPKKPKKVKSRKLVKGQSKITSFVSTKKETEDNIQDDQEEALALGIEYGFPNGWTVRKKPHGRFDIRSPGDALKFKTIANALSFLRSQENTADSVKGNKKKGSSTKAALIAKGEEGDPPWRRVDHEYLGRSVRYPTEPNGSKYQVGKVTGWLSEKDVDSEGNPGFISEKYDKPAKLFHVSFDVKEDGLLFVDLEEFELEETLTDEQEEVQSKEEDTADEDDLPLSKVLKKSK